MRTLIIMTIWLLAVQSTSAYPIIWQKISSRQPHSNSFTAEQTTININTADKNMLQKLTGIGPKKAEDIVRYREQHGLFKEIIDIEKVKGFSKKVTAKIIEKNKGLISLH